jgi:hypothetical protein
LTGLRKPRSSVVNCASDQRCSKDATFGRAVGRIVRINSEHLRLQCNADEITQHADLTRRISNEVFVATKEGLIMSLRQGGLRRVGAALPQYGNCHRGDIGAPDARCLRAKNAVPSGSPFPDRRLGNQEENGCRRLSQRCFLCGLDLNVHKSGECVPVAFSGPQPVHKIGRREKAIDQTLCIRRVVAAIKCTQALDDILPCRWVGLRITDSSPPP